MRAVLGTIEAIAARRQLTVSRLPALWLTLDRNLRWWYGGERLLGSGTRVEFEGSELVWQYYPGQGLQFQVLGNFGKLNGLVTGYFYHRASFMMDELLPLAAEPRRRDRVGVLLRVRRRPRAVGERDGAGHRGAGAGARRAPAGAGATRCCRSPPRRCRCSSAARRPACASRPPYGDHYALYSFAPSLRVANGFVQSLVGPARLRAHLR